MITKAYETNLFKSQVKCNLSQWLLPKVFVKSKNNKVSNIVNKKNDVELKNISSISFRVSEENLKNIYRKLRYSSFT